MQMNKIKWTDYKLFFDNNFSANLTTKPNTQLTTLGKQSYVASSGQETQYMRHTWVS